MALRKFLYIDDTEGFSAEHDATDEISLGKVTVTGLTGVGLDASSTRIVNVSTPTSDQDAANKAYVDSVASGLDVKESVRALSDANVASLSGLPTNIDSVTTGWANGQRVLLTAQTDPLENGIWVVDAGAWTRPADFNTGDAVAAAFTFVEEGTTYADTGWVCTNDSGSDVVGTDGLNFSQFSGAGGITAGAGLDKTGSTIFIGDGAGINVLADSIEVELATNPGLEFDVGGVGGALRVKIDDTPDTLDVDADGLKVVGLPSLFKVNDTAVGATVTAANLDTLTDGSNADALHTHAEDSLEDDVTATEAIAVGDPVAWSTTANEAAMGDAANDADSRIVGVATTAAAASNPFTMVRRGIAAGVLVGATAGTPYYLASGGGVTTTVPSGVGNRIVRVGYAINATDLEVIIHDFGKRR